MNFLLLSPLFRFVITPTCISKIKYPYLGKLHSTPISLRCRLKRDNSYDFLSNLCCQQLDKIYNKIIQSTCLKMYIKIYIFKKYLKNNKSKIIGYLYYNYINVFALELPKASVSKSGF